MAKLQSTGKSNRGRGSGSWTHKTWIDQPAAERDAE